jgi:hypothetical protein
MDERTVSEVARYELEQRLGGELRALIREQREDMRHADRVMPEKADGVRVDGYGVFLPWESEADGMDGDNGYLVERKVKATEPWNPATGIEAHPAQVRNGGRPRVRNPRRYSDKTRAGKREKNADRRYAYGLLRLSRMMDRPAV